MTEDKSDFDIYDDPRNRRPAGPGRPVPATALSTHVPVRFSPETVALVKYLAADDNLTVSAWIRREIEKAITRRIPRPRSGSWIAATFTPSERSDASSRSQSGAGYDSDLNREVSCSA